MTELLTAWGRLGAVSAVAVVLLTAGCELNQGTPDAEATLLEDTGTTVDEDSGPSSPFNQDTTQTPTDTDSNVPPTTQSDCNWVGGTWDLADCTGQNIVAQFVANGCGFSVTSNSPALVGASGVAYQSGLTLSVPPGQVCHGFYDGTWLTGACNPASDLPCWFIAKKQ